MSEYRFTLERYRGKKSRHTCPSCGMKGEFALYIDNETGLHLPEHIGRCNREQNCGYHYTPKEYFKDSPEAAQPLKSDYLKTPKRPAVHIPLEEMAASRTGWVYNTFFDYLVKLFGPDVAYDLVQTYPVGTITGTHYSGAAVFWFVNVSGSIRAGQVKLFDETGHTAKHSNGKPRTTWIHSLLEQQCHKQGVNLPDWLKGYIEQPERVTCLYGEHLLIKHPSKPVAIVEAPKTAIIASQYFPQFVWLAAGARSYLTFERCQALKGRDVRLFPDLGTFDEWTLKAELLSSLFGSVSVDDTLEKVATPEEISKGLDLADYLTRSSLAKVS